MPPVQAQCYARSDVDRERRDDDEGLGERIALVVGAGEEEVGGGGADGAGGEREEGGVGDVGEEEGGECVGGVFVEA